MPLPRIVNAILGIWLCVSAFIWPHEIAQFWAAALGGALVATIAFAGGTFPGARYLNTIVAAAIFAFTLARPAAEPLTKRHDATIAVLVFLVALVPGFARDDDERRIRTSRTV